MNRCAVCGFDLPQATTLCANHHVRDVGWARTNRVMCDFLHRGLVPPRVSPADRDEARHGCLVEVAA